MSCFINLNGWNHRDIKFGEADDIIIGNTRSGYPEQLQSDSKTHVKFEYAFYLGKGLSMNVFDMANKMSHMWY